MRCTLSWLSAKLNALLSNLHFDQNGKLRCEFALLVEDVANFIDS